MVRQARAITGNLADAGASQMASFRFHCDPGHGWLQVSWSDLKNLGLNPWNFSRYSYRRGNQFYLEEDCDAPKFLNTYQAKTGQRPDLEEVHTNHRSFIRNLPSIHSGLPEGIVAIDLNDPASMHETLRKILGE
jgi:hypothetical protein